MLCSATAGNIGEDAVGRDVVCRSADGDRHVGGRIAADAEASITDKFWKVVPWTVKVKAVDVLLSR